MLGNDLTALSAFVVVAEERSFTRAAKRLGVTPSAISHAMRGLEERVGIRLLSRTTRSVAPTDAGRDLLVHLHPALSEVHGALDRVAGMRNKPAGRVRLLVPRLAAGTVLAPKLGEFARKFHEIVLDVTMNDSRMDIVAAGFDAGIHFGEYIEKDMIAVRVSPDHKPVIVGSPGYLKSHGKPKSPRDLLRHRCINFRHGDAGLYRWEFEKGKKALSVAVNGPLIVDDLDLVTRAALDDVGLAYMSEEHAAPYLAEGTLVRMLESWCQPFPGFYLYYPSRRQQPAALSALIETLRM
ncbi:MAG TPA: LysR family transcriptional regulator [Terracidiphilus sp.]|nr:LysR family transcriptional regulator [Terracidiphilus sp.]HEV2400663.1 LysR family transcriptional regulator [Candidatus Sulfotelmatobacter sp.]